MIANVTMAFQTAAITGKGITPILTSPRYVTFRVTGNGPVSAGVVTRISRKLTGKPQQLELKLWTRHSSR
jgi:hypothetical protein